LGCQVLKEKDKDKDKETNQTIIKKEIRKLEEV